MLFHLGFSGAQLESLTNEAAILAFREKLKCLDTKHFKEAIDKVIMGEKLDRVYCDLKNPAL